MDIAILTPTFNRKKLLYRLYQSLNKQVDLEFSWIVIDDGSTDDTQELIEMLQQDSNNFIIKYYKKNNRGKCCALNYAFERCNNFDFLVVVDSDDYLLPNSILEIRKKYELYKNNISVGAIFFRYKDTEGTVLSSKKRKIMKNDTIMTRYNHDYVYGKYDGCIGYYSRCFSKYRYPEYNNENYIAPTIIQLIMAEEFKIAFTTSIVGVAEYLNSGLTKSGRRLRINNPLGMMHYCGLLLSEKNPSIFGRIKYGIMIQAYYILSNYKKRDIINLGIDKKKFKLYYLPFGYILAAIWGLRLNIR